MSHVPRQNKEHTKAVDKSRVDTSHQYWFGLRFHQWGLQQRKQTETFRCILSHFATYWDIIRAQLQSGVRSHVIGKRCSRLCGYVLNKTPVSWIVTLGKSLGIGHAICPTQNKSPRIYHTCHARIVKKNVERNKIGHAGYLQPSLTEQ